MKAIYIVALVAIVGFIGFLQMNQNNSTPSNDNMVNLWTQWKVQYGALYTDASEDAYRLSVFTSNYQKIQAHNAKKSTYKMAVNKFANLTGDEFKNTWASCTGDLGTNDEVEDPYCPSAENCESLPAPNMENQVNWTTAGAVTGIKNQGQCGSCWSFSTTGAIEGLYFLNHSLLVSFSEQQIVSCDTGCYACDGCWPYLAMEYTAQAGLEPEKIYPYVSGNGEVPACNYKSALALNVNTGYQCVQQENAEQLIAALNMQPVSIAVEADQNAWQFYSSGVVNSECGAALDHAVLLVGWGPYEGEEEFSYFVKNSWGTDWGMQGFIWLGGSE